MVTIYELMMMHQKPHMKTHSNSSYIKYTKACRRYACISNGRIVDEMSINSTNWTILFLTYIHSACVKFQTIFCTMKFIYIETKQTSRSHYLSTIMVIYTFIIHRPRTTGFYGQYNIYVYRNHAYIRLVNFGCNIVLLNKL